MTNDSLRRAAILINALDHQSADVLLDQMPPEQAALVRRAIMELETVNDVEQQDVIAQFMRPNTPDGPAGTDGVELALSGYTPDCVTPRQEAPIQDPPNKEPPSLPHLHQADTEQLFTLLGHEQPQTIAVVASQLSPERASELLVRLPVPLQTNVLRRVAMLGDTDPQIVREIQETIDTRLSQPDQARRHGSSGIVALQAILAVTDPHRRESLLASLAKHDPSLVQQLNRDTTAASAEPLPRAGQPGQGAAPSPSPAEYNLPRQGDPDSPVLPKEPAPDLTSDLVPPPATAVPLDLTFADLAELDERGWATVLCHATPEVVLIALAGADDRMVEGILRQIPSRQARLFQRQMCQLGPIRLRDVERAQQQLARLAGTYASRG